MAPPTDRSIRAYIIIWFGKHIFKMAAIMSDILSDICQEQENYHRKSGRHYVGHFV